MNKERWFQAFEREMSEMEDEGLPTEEAYRLASKNAFAKAQEALAERIDWLHQEQKDKDSS